MHWRATALMPALSTHLCVKSTCSAWMRCLKPSAKHTPSTLDRQSRHCQRKHTRIRTWVGQRESVVMCRWVRVSKSSQTGIRRRSRHPTTRSISASTGDAARRRFDARRGAPACVAVSRPCGEQGYRRICDSAAQPSGCEGCFGIPNPSYT